MGHRNIQGMVLIDEQTIIATEHGPRGGDEINIISTNSLEKLLRYHRMAIITLITLKKHMPQLHH